MSITKTANKYRSKLTTGDAILGVGALLGGAVFSIFDVGLEGALLGAGAARYWSNSQYKAKEKGKFRRYGTIYGSIFAVAGIEAAIDLATGVHESFPSALPWSAIAYGTGELGSYLARNRQKETWYDPFY